MIRLTQALKLKLTNKNHSFALISILWLDQYLKKSIWRNQNLVSLFVVKALDDFGSLTLCICAFPNDIMENENDF